MNTGNIKKILTLVALISVLTPCADVQAGFKINLKPKSKHEEKQTQTPQEKSKELFNAVSLSPSLHRTDIIIERINEALKKGADINATDENGNSVLFVAWQHQQDKEVMDALIAAGAKENDADITKRGEIAEEATKHLVSLSKNTFLSIESLNKELAKGADVNGTDEEGHSVLFLVEHKGQQGESWKELRRRNKEDSRRVELLNALVAAGAKKNDVDLAKEREMAEREAKEATETLVSKAKKDSLRANELKTLIEEGANVNATDENGNSVLFIVGRRIKKTTPSDASSEATPTPTPPPTGVSRRDRMGMAATMEVKQPTLSQDEIIYNALVEAGAKRNKVDDCTELLDLCKGSRAPSEFYGEKKLIADPERVQVLIDSGVDVNTQDQEGNSALYLAETNENLEVIPLLTKAGAQMKPGEPEKLKEESTERLFKLVETLRPENVKERVELYISWGGDVNAKNANGHSLLLMALHAQTVKSGVGSMTEAATKDSATALGMRQASEETTTVMKALAGDNGEGLFSNPLCATLIAAGAEASKDEMTQIYFINLKTGNWAFIKELRDHNIDLKAEGNGGKNAFHVMSESPHVAPNDSVIDALLKAGVNMEKKAEFDDAFLTPLGYAVYNKHVAAVRVLLAHGANRKATAVIKDVMDNRSESLIDLARSRYNKLKQTHDLLMTQRKTPDVVQTLHALDAAMRDYQEIISMLR